jgi:hypothetical protein
VDETILGLLSVLFPLDSITLTKFDYCQFLQEVINFQLSNFHLNKSFRYQAYMVHLILFNNSSFFDIFGIKTIDNSSKTKSIIEWTEEVRKQDQNKGFNLYVNKFMSACS